MLFYAEELLRYFVVQFTQLYGNEYVYYNIHSMIHLADNCRKYGKLDAFSAFPFENRFQNVKINLKKKCLNLLFNLEIENLKNKVLVLKLLIFSLTIQYFQNKKREGPLMSGILGDS